MSQGVDIAKQGYDVAEPYLRDAINIAAPYIRQALNLSGEALNNFVIPSIKKAVPIIQDAIAQFAEAQGVRTAGISSSLDQVEGKITQATTNAQPLF